MSNTNTPAALDKAVALENIVSKLNDHADSLERLGFAHLAEHIDSITAELNHEHGIIVRGGPHVQIAAFPGKRWI